MARRSPFLATRDLYGILEITTKTVRKITLDTRQKQEAGKGIAAQRIGEEEKLLRLPILIDGKWPDFVGP